MDLIIKNLKLACIEISYILQNHIPACTKTGKFNKSGDNQDAIDLLVNDIFKNYLRECDNIYALVSEEDEKIIYLNKNGEYFVVFDPLDGSSNINVNISTGSIFGIFKLNGKKIFDLTGKDIVCAGYCLYSASTLLVLCQENLRIKKAKQQNCLDFGNLEEERSSHPKMYILRNKCFDEINSNIIMPEKGKVYAINEGNKYKWEDNVANLVDKLVREGRSCRWCACMVGDIHRILLEGGIFMYPGDKKNKNGKLRLVYEGYPFAYIVEKANGLSTNGKCSILDIPFPKNIHQKIPMFFGGKHEMEIL